MSIKKIFYIFSFIFFFSFTACTHLNSNNCLAINWYELGRQDSTKGLKWSSTFSERRRTCRLKKDSVQAKAHKNGFDAGLREFCSFKTGYIYGLSGTKQKIKSCPKALKQSFAKGYKAGAYMMEIQNLQNQIQTKVNNLEEKIGDYKNKPSVTINSSNK